MHARSTPVFFCLTLLAYVEALHYVCVACEKWDAKLLIKYPRALKCHALVNTPVKLKKFLVGRQFFVIFVVFLIAQLTSFPDIPKNFAGMPELMVTILLKTGLPGVALVLTYGQLISQIFVEQYPAQFLNLYGTEFVIHMSLFTENIGTCHWAWLLYHSVSSVACRAVNVARDQMKVGPVSLALPLESLLSHARLTPLPPPSLLPLLPSLPPSLPSVFRPHQHRRRRQHG